MTSEPSGIPGEPASAPNEGGVATAAHVGAASTRQGAPQRATFLRIERKTLVDPRRLGLVRAWLAHTCVPAPDYPEGQVTSCYYDTLQMDEYFASFDGDFEKNKVRLRWYDSVPSGGEAVAFVELKSKQGMETVKQRAALAVPARALAHGDFAAALPRETLTRLLLSFGYRPPLDLQPVAVVTYHRYRFVERHSQMTLSLDSDVRAWLADGQHWPAVTLEGAVLELKGRTFELPSVLRGLGRFGRVWSAFSKYGASIEALADVPGAFRP